MDQFKTVEKIKISVKKNEAATVLKTDVEVNFNNVIRTWHCFARNESFMLATHLTFEWIFEAMNDKQLTKIYCLVTMIFDLNETLKIN